MSLLGRNLVTQNLMIHLRLDSASRSLAPTGALPPHQQEDAHLLQVKAVGLLRKDSLFYHNAATVANKFSLIPLLLGRQRLNHQAVWGQLFRRQPKVDNTAVKKTWWNHIGRLGSRCLFSKWHKDSDLFMFRACVKPWPLCSASRSHCVWVRVFRRGSNCVINSQCY